MKITRINDVAFHRIPDEGFLTQAQSIYQAHNGERKTTKLIGDLDLSRSYSGRLLKKPNKDKELENDSMRNFVVAVCKCAAVSNEEDEIPELRLESDLQEEDIRGEINRNLSFYGKGLRWGKDKQDSFKTLFEAHVRGENTHDARVALVAELKRLQLLKRERLRGSIEKNRFPFEVSSAGDGFAICSDKYTWFMSLLNVAGSNDSALEHMQAKLKQYEDFYDFEILLAKVISELEKKSPQFKNLKESGDKGRMIGQIVYRCVKAYNDERYKKWAEPPASDTDKRAFSYYLCLVRDYFRGYFCSNASKKRESLTVTKKRDWLLDRNYIVNSIRRQLCNQMVAFLIQYGKLYDYCKSSNWGAGKTQAYLSSYGLSLIQIEEAFKKQFLTCVAWGIVRLNFFYNYTGDYAGASPSETNDILVNSDCTNAFTDSLLDGSVELGELTEKLSGFFHTSWQTTNPETNKEVCNELSCEERKLLLTSVLASARMLRNALHHFSMGNFSALLESKKEDVLKDSGDVVKQMYCCDVGLLANSFEEQVRSMGIARFYNLPILKYIFLKVGFQLYERTMEAAPSFKNLYVKGANMQKSVQGAAGANNIGSLVWYWDSADNAEQLLAYKNLLKLLYYHAFLPLVKDNEPGIQTLFASAIEQTKMLHEQSAVKFQKMKKEPIDITAHGYHDMPFLGDKSVQEYFAAVQSAGVVYQSDLANKGDDTKKNKYTLFVQDVFARAFNNYVSELLPKKAHVELQKTITESAEMEKSTLSELFGGKQPLLTMKTKLPIEDVPADLSLLAVYPFLKILDESELNALQHQLFRFRCSMGAMYEREDDGQASGEPAADDAELALYVQLEELIALILFTRPIPGTQKGFNAIANNRFATFVEGDIRKNDLYAQENESLVPRRSMALVNRSGLMAFYEEMYKDTNCFFVTEQDCTAYKEQNLRENDTSPIKEKQKTLRDMHSDLVRKKSSTVNHDGVTAYQRLLTEVNDYNNLRKKVTFEHLYRLHRIHSDLLGHLVAFAQDWERDFRFLFLALVKLGIWKGVTEQDVYTIFDGKAGRIVKKISELLQKENNIADRHLIVYLGWQKNWIAAEDEKGNYEGGFTLFNALNIRNDIAHFNQIRETNKSLADSINALRTLLAYDRKRQNAITKVVIKCLEKHGLVLHFVCRQKDGEAVYEIHRASSVPILHLKNLGSKSISLPTHPPEMERAVEKLLLFTKTKN